MLSNYELLIRLLAAAVLGGLIGYERERLSWFAGLRTHMLVCVGAALIMIVSQYGFNDVLRQNLVVLDPSRVAAQVVSGIGFLGAGTILFWRKMIRGLTTAASLWAVSAVGLAAGAGLYLASFSATFFILLILAGLKPLERRFLKKQQAKGISISSKPGQFSLSSLESALVNLDLKGLTRLTLELSEDQEVLHVLFKTPTTIDLIRVMGELKKLPGVETIEFIE